MKRLILELSCHQRLQKIVYELLPLIFLGISCINSICAKIGIDTRKVLSVFRLSQDATLQYLFIYGKGKQCTGSLVIISTSCLSVQWWIIHLKHLMKHLNVSNSWKGLLLFCMTGQTHVALSTKPDNNCFARKNRSLENLALTQDTPFQHLLRVAFQSRIWIMAAESSCQIPTLSE